MRTAAQRDVNEPEIIEALEKAGYSVQQLNATGVPDLLVGRGDLWLLEVKMPGKDLNPQQQLWWKRWRGKRPQIVRSVEEALAAVGVKAK